MSDDSSKSESDDNHPDAEKSEAIEAEIIEAVVALPTSIPVAQPAIQPAVEQTEGDATGGLIPYKNPHALTAYYLAIVAMFPCIGFLFGIPAFVLGIIGLKRRKANPAIKGSVHAWIGIILGGSFSLMNLAGTVYVVWAIFYFNSDTNSGPRVVH